MKIVHYPSIRQYSIFRYALPNSQILRANLNSNDCPAMPFDMSWLSPTLHMRTINTIISENYFVLTFTSGIARITTLNPSASKH
jgi:hypothetical protein